MSLKAKWLIVMDKKGFKLEAFLKKRGWMRNKVHEKLLRIIKLDMGGLDLEMSKAKIEQERI